MYFDMEQKTIGGLISYAAKRWGDKTAVFSDSRNYTFKEIDELSDKFALGLIKKGIKKGDRIGIWMHNHPEWNIAWFGVAKAGAIGVPLDYWYKAPETQYIAWHSEAKAIITTDAMFGVDFPAMVKEIKPSLPNLEFCAIMGKPTEPWMTSFEDIYKLGEGASNSKELAERKSQIKERDLVFILYTSGTTGKPKGASLSHRNIIMNAWYTGAGLKVNDKDNILVPIPYSHCFGNTLALTLAVLRGAAQTPMISYDPKKALEYIEKYKCTAHHGVPTMFVREVEALKEVKRDVSSLRTGIIAGAPCPEGLIRRVKDTIGCTLLNTYGQTEASPVITMSIMGDDFAVLNSAVGKPIAGVEVRIVDPATNEELPTGQQGELVCRGHCVMEGGYFKQPDKTKEAIDEGGWLHTGDLATQDEYGYYRITGRIKDMVIVGGFNVFPKIIEDHIIQHPKIQEVSVTGIKDYDLGEIVVAAVIPKNGQSIEPVEIVDWCYGKMSSAAVPRYVIITDKLPISGRGKVQKFKLQEQFNELIKEGKVKKTAPTAAKAKK